MPTYHVPRQSQGGLTLSEDLAAPVESALWIGSLVMLGSRAAHWARTNQGKQLVIGLTVPVRDFAAVLIGCGWMMAAPAPQLQPVRQAVASLVTGTPVRVVTETRIMTDRFQGVDTARDHLKLAGLGGGWKLAKVSTIAPLPSIGASRRQPLPTPGVISRMAGLQADWAARMCVPPADLALVGTVKWLQEDMAAYIGRGDEREQISNILMPYDAHTATWSTRLYPASRLDEDLPPSDLRAAVLDGASAASYLSAITTPVVVVVLDRSIMDESAAGIVLSYRNSYGEPLSVRHDVRWTPPPGIEAFGFAVPL